MNDQERDEAAEALARRFHEAYERLAPSFSYETREASAKPWEQVPENNRALMVAVCREVLPAAEARGREQGRREAIEKLRAEANRRVHDALGEWMESGYMPLLIAADFLDTDSPQDTGAGWEARTLAAPGAAERVDQIEAELRAAVAESTGGPE